MTAVVCVCIRMHFPDLITLFNLFDKALCQKDAVFIESGSLCVRQRDQEEVRRRFASITYSDPLFLKQPGPAGKKNEEAKNRRFLHLHKIVICKCKA